MKIPERMEASFEREQHPYYMYESMMSTPDGLKKVLEKDSREKISAAARLLQPVNQVHFIGNGTSYFNSLAARYPMHAIAEKLAIPHYAYDFLTCPPAGLNENSGLVAISHSGGSPATVDAAEMGKARGMKTVTICNKAESALGKVGDILIYSENNEVQGPKTRGYVASVLRSYLLAAEIGQFSGKDLSGIFKELEKSPELADSILKEQEAAVKEFAQKRAAISRSRIVFSGGGEQFPTASEASLKVIETAMVHAAPWEIEEAVHGPWVSVKPRELIVLFAMEGASFEKNRILAKGMKTIDADIWAITNHPQGLEGADFNTILPAGLPEWAYALYTILPVYQFIYYYTLALGGLHPDRAPYEDPRFMDARIQMRSFR